MAHRHVREPDCRAAAQPSAYGQEARSAAIASFCATESDGARVSRLLDGQHSLWSDFREYVLFIAAHQDEIYNAKERGDEVAALIVDTIIAIDERGQNPHLRATLMIAVERYIHDHHPEIAIIPGGYPK
jgi:hypothetical protein